MRRDTNPSKSLRPSGVASRCGSSSAVRAATFSGLRNRSTIAAPHSSMALPTSATSTSAGNLGMAARSPTVGTVSGRGLIRR